MVILGAGLVYCATLKLPKQKARHKFRRTSYICIVGCSYYGVRLIINYPFVY